MRALPSCSAGVRRPIALPPHHRSKGLLWQECIIVATNQSPLPIHYSCYASFNCQFADRFETTKKGEARRRASPPPQSTLPRSLGKLFPAGRIFHREFNPTTTPGANRAS
jgi:hypothetical protein